MVEITEVEEEEITGIYNACAPHPVSNADFMKALRRALNIPIGIPSPALLTKIGARILRTDPELALYGRYVISSRLNEVGFVFRFPEVEGALKDLLMTSSHARRSLPAAPGR